jgi:hypothetical protein
MVSGTRTCNNSRRGGRGFTGVANGPSPSASASALAFCARMAARRSSNFCTAPDIDKSRVVRLPQAYTSRHNIATIAIRPNWFQPDFLLRKKLSSSQPYLLPVQPKPRVEFYFGRLGVPLGRTSEIFPMASVITSRAIVARLRLIHSSMSGRVTTATAWRMVSRERPVSNTLE